MNHGVTNTKQVNETVERSLTSPTCTLCSVTFVWTVARVGIFKSQNSTQTFQRCFNDTVLLHKQPLPVFHSPLSLHFSHLSLTPCSPRFPVSCSDHERQSSEVVPHGMCRQAPIMGHSQRLRIQGIGGENNFHLVKSRLLNRDQFEMFFLTRVLEH